MRSWFLLALTCLACGKTALPKGGIDAAADVAALGGADASDGPVQDAVPAPDTVEIGPDLGVSPDLPPPNRDSGLGADLPPAIRDATVGPDLLPDSAAGCTPLPIAQLALEPAPFCPPSSAPAACAGSDVGAVVARSQACVSAWGAIPFQCVLWPSLGDGQELVVFEVPNCLDSLDIERAQACGDHIELAYVVGGVCQECDENHSVYRAFTLPLDPRPVIATGRTIIPPCPPPVPDGGGPTDSGGATGAGGAGKGGAAGAGGIAGTGGRTGSGGTAGTTIDGGCPQTRIDPTQAAAAYAAYAGLAPSTAVQAEELAVPGLWEEMHAQLFNANRYFDGGSPSPACSFIYRDCVLTMLTDTCNMFGPIASGVASDGAFYYSWASGSGIYRTNFGKLAPSGATLVKTTSGGYTNPGYGPPPLVLALEAHDILVYRPTDFPSDFNQWQGGELVGTLGDRGDRLVIVDVTGAEIPATFP